MRVTKKDGVSMAGINFNGNFNNKINNTTKNNIVKNNRNNTSNASDFKPTFGNTMSGDTLEISTKKDNDLTTGMRFSTRRAPKTWSQINKEEWNRRGGVENYNGKGANEMGFSVFVSTTVRWVWNKLFRR